VDRGGKLGLENLFAVRKKENQDGRQPILTIAGILLLRSLGFFGPEGLNNQKLLVVFRCLLRSVWDLKCLFFPSVIFFVFFIAIFRLVFVVYDMCLLFAGYVLFVCFILLLAGVLHVTGVEMHSRSDAPHVAYRKYDVTRFVQHTILLLNDCRSCHGPITRNRQSQRRMFYLRSLVDVSITLFGVAISLLVL